MYEDHSARSSLRADFSFISYTMAVSIQSIFISSRGKAQLTLGMFLSSRDRARLSQGRARSSRGRAQRRPGFLITLVLIISCSFFTVGCNQDVKIENDRLRAEALDLKEQVSDLIQQLKEANIASQATDATVLPGEELIRQATPRLTELKIDDRSHARDESNDGLIDTLVIYITPRDGWGRFVQLVGELSVHAAVLPASTDAKTIGRIALDPLEVRRAYRATILGTHYTIELPIDLANVNQPECLIQVEFHDALTDQRHSAEHSIELHSGR